MQVVFCTKVQLLFLFAYPNPHI